MKDDLKVTIVIPTYNSGKTIKRCLESVKNQTYRKIESIIVDSYSTDETLEIIDKFDVKLIKTRQKLLGARYIGLKKSEGVYQLLLDSDQILKPNTIENALDFMKRYDMLILEEFTYKPKTWIEKLYEADRNLVHKIRDINPYTSVLLPRFYKRDIIVKAFENIPKDILPIVGGQDHAIIYLEAFKLSEKVGFLPDAVYHIEPSSMIQLMKKNFRWGKTSRGFVDMGYYKDLVHKKIRFRKDAFKSKNIELVLQSYLLLILKGVPYKLGYWFGK